MRGDNKFNNVSGTVMLHIECRKSYTRKSSILSDLNQACASTASNKAVPTTLIKNKVRSSHQSLQLKSKCLFCFEIIPDNFSDIQKKKPVENRQIVCTVTSLNVGQAKKRNDVWGKEVEKRLANEIDVVAADVIYHKHCFVNFFKSSSSGNLKRGRPQNESIMVVMEKIYSILENSEECQFSIENDILSCIDYEYVPDIKTIRVKLLEKYGENIVISSANKKNTTVCF